MAWAYPRLGWITMAEIARAHRDAATELKVEVAPVGLAWQRAMQQRSTLNLYAADREHPSLYGTYLATAVVYATSDDAAFLRRVAWESLQDAGR